MKDSKSWVRQWLVFMFAGALIVAVFCQMLLDVELPWWFLAIAGGFVGEYTIGREIEKRRKQ